MRKLNLVTDHTPLSQAEAYGEGRVGAVRMLWTVKRPSLSSGRAANDLARCEDKATRPTRPRKIGEWYAVKALRLMMTLSLDGRRSVF